MILLTLARTSPAAPNSRAGISVGPYVLRDGGWARACECALQPALFVFAGNPHPLACIHVGSSIGELSQKKGGNNASRNGTGGVSRPRILQWWRGTRGRVGNLCTID